MKWKWCDNKGKDSEHETSFQKDEVGNILQKSGAVMTKACQNCGDEFNVKVNQDEVRQDMDKFKCTKCKFESNNPQDALVHTIKKKTHSLEIEKDSRIVGYKNTLSDHPIITFKDDDCIIVCQKCNGID